MEMGSKIQGNGLALNRRKNILSSESEKISKDEDLVCR